MARVIRRPSYCIAIAAAAAAAVAFASDTAIAAGPSALGACFAPATLMSQPGENVPQKGVRTFDRFDTPAQTLVPFAPVPEALRGAVRRVELPKGKKLIALTLDLCEQRGEIAGYDGPIFDYLRAEKVPATLFAGGKWMASHDARTRQLMSDPLFELGNHAGIHGNLRLMQGKALDAEINAPQRVFERIRAAHVSGQCLASAPQAAQSIQPRLALFRFPFGACNAEALKAVNDAGLVAIQWDLSTGDPSPSQSAAAIAEAMVRHARPGSIIIAHANGRGHHTAAALPIAIPKLKAAGFQFVTVSELMRQGRPVVEQICYDSHPGDTDRYDALFLKPPQHPAKQAPSEQPGWFWPWSSATTVTPSRR